VSSVFYIDGFHELGVQGLSADECGRCVLCVRSTATAAVVVDELSMLITLLLLVLVGDQQCMCNTSDTEHPAQLSACRRRPRQNTDKLQEVHSRF